MKRKRWLVWGLLAVFGFAGSASAQNVSRALLERDLAYVVKTVSEVHPALVKAEMKRALTDRAASLVQRLPEEVPRWRVGVTVAELLRVVNDGHTSTDMTFGSSRYLPLQFAWLSDGLVVAPVTGSKVDIPVVSEVLKVSNLDTAALERKLARLVSENRYWVREIGAGNLPAESVLRWLGVVEDDTVTLTFRTPSGEAMRESVELTSYERTVSADLNAALMKARGLGGGWRVLNDVVAWRVDKSGNYGFFWLQRCEDTPEYRNEVQRFFEEVVDAGVENLVISVQQNGGGNSGVIDVLVERLPVNRYKSFAGSIRFSQVVLENQDISLAQIEQESTGHTGNVYNFPASEITVAERTGTFDDMVYVLTDSGSASAAVDVAAILHDNNLATLVGEPTGGMATSFGDYLEFSTPNLDLPFRISHKRFVRPDPSRDPADTLMPGIPLPVTVKDVQTGYSPISAWLEHFGK